MIHGERPYIRRRYPKLEIDPEGYPYRGIPVKEEILASIQPATGRELERLPEGIRGRVTMIAYTFADLQAADDRTSIQSDEIEMGDEVYQVEAVQRWQDDWDEDTEGESHLTQAFLRRLDPVPEEVELEWRFASGQVCFWRW